MSLASDLLKQARQLAMKEPLKPRQASLRRAVSAAYYALFHLLIDEATGRLISGEQRRRLRQVLGRAFGHAEMKIVARGFANGGVSRKLQPALAGEPVQDELKNVAAAFVDLQAARHEADYDTARRFTREEALDLIDQAETAFQDWKDIRKSLQADTFLVGLLAQKQMKGL
ncbi:MAG: hypothetical protein AAFX50_18980 [Acidobacteriota bacterium]